MDQIGTGRDADIFDLGDGTVLRRNRDGRPQQREAEIMRQVRAAGYPVPEVISASGADLVMEKITGPTFLEDAALHPWHILQHAETLARLHLQLHRIEPPDILDRPWPNRIASIVHLDFHPGNVMASPGGPIVIDWANAVAGPAAIDTGMTELLLRTGQIQGNAVLRSIGGVARSRLHRRYRKVYGPVTDGGRWLGEAAELKLLDRNLQPTERHSIESLIEKL